MGNYENVYKIYQKIGYATRNILIIAFLTIVATSLVACSDPTNTPASESPTVELSLNQPESSKETTLVNRRQHIELFLNRLKSSRGTTLFNQRRDNNIYLIDNWGSLGHKWTLEVPTVLTRFLENGNPMAMGAENQLHHGVQEIDSEENTVLEYQHSQYHDFLKLPNGNVLLISGDGRLTEESTAAGANSDYARSTNYRLTHIIEVETTGPHSGQVVWEWAGWDHLTPTVGLILNRPGSFEGYTLFNRRRDNRIYLIDNWGRVVHKWVLEVPTVFAKLLKNGNLMAMGAGNQPHHGVREIDPEGNIVWEYKHSQHHDFLKLPNGNVLLVSSDYRLREDAIAAGANPDYILGPNYRLTRIVEVEPTGPRSGQVVWEWSGWDHLIQDYDPAKPNYGVVSDHPELININHDGAALAAYRDSGDRMHTNAIDYNPELDQIILSPRHYSELWIIDHSTTTAEAAGHTGGNSGKGGDLLYRWGNPRTYRMGTLADQQLFGQHNIQWIAPGLPGAGNILIFNNGFGLNLRLEGPYSSVEEIVPPLEGSNNYWIYPGSPYAPTEPVWQYTAAVPTDWFSPIVSGVQRLPNGNTLICDGPHGTFFEVTPSGRTVWMYVSPMLESGPLTQGELPPVERIVTDPKDSESQIGDVWENLVFRIHRYAPDYPGLQGLDLTPGAPIELYDPL